MVQAVSLTAASYLETLKTGSDGTIHELSDYRGTAVVLAWFPKAFTGG